MDGEHVGVRAQGDKSRRDEWSEGGVVSLLEAYESKWSLRNRAKLKGSDWDEIARHVSLRCSGNKAPKTPNQCKNKIESMKKRYRSESTSSTWQFYTRMTGLLKGNNNDDKNNENAIGDVHVLPKVESNQDDDGSNTLPNNVVNNQSMLRSEVGRNRSKRRRDDGTAAVAESIRLFAHSMLKIEEARMEMYKDVERLRAEADVRRSEMELKRTEIIAETQLQIARVFSRMASERDNNNNHQNEAEGLKGDGKGS